MKGEGGGEVWSWKGKAQGESGQHRSPLTPCVPTAARILGRQPLPTVAPLARTHGGLPKCACNTHPPDSHAPANPHPPLAIPANPRTLLTYTLLTHIPSGLLPRRAGGRPLPAAPRGAVGGGGARRAGQVSLRAAHGGGGALNHAAGGEEVVGMRGGDVLSGKVLY